VSAAAEPSPYDEAYDERGEPRPHYAELLASLEDPGALSEEVRRRLGARGVTFGAEPARVDPVPRILTAAEWSELQAEIEQRLRTLEALVADVYGCAARPRRAGAASWSASVSSPKTRETSCWGGSTASRSRTVSRAATAYAMPDGIRSTVILSEGPSAEPYWEHERLARELCATPRDAR
jgi:uncharacterized circularly permuted ATP-grasp superfamily protein